MKSLKFIVLCGTLVVMSNVGAANQFVEVNKNCALQKSFTLKDRKLVRSSCNETGKPVKNEKYQQTKSSKQIAFRAESKQMLTDA